MTFEVEALVVGAGAVGLACGLALAGRNGTVLVLDAEDAIGTGVSSRNSEVIHGGLYYPTGSLKARLCVEGRRRLYDFLDTHRVAYNRCGKLVVATEPEEEPRLDDILTQARTNGVEGMAALTGAQARAMEPELRATAALLSPESGVFDSHGYMAAMQGRIEDTGGQVVMSTPFVGATPLPGAGFEVRTGGADPFALTARHLVLAAGLGAQGAAASVEGFPPDAIPKLHYGKGVYFAYVGKAPFSRLIYPLPIPGALGTHYRRDLGGQARFGPDLRFVDELDYDVEPERASGFYETIRRFWPAIPEDSLVPDYAGVRPKLHGPAEPHADWRIDDETVHGLEGLVALFGIESPGLTGSLAIGDEVARRLCR